MDIILPSLSSTWIAETAVCRTSEGGGLKGNRRNSETEEEEEERGGQGDRTL